MGKFWSSSYPAYEERHIDSTDCGLYTTPSYIRPEETVTANIWNCNVINFTEHELMMLHGVITVISDHRICRVSTELPSKDRREEVEKWINDKLPGWSWHISCYDVEDYFEKIHCCARIKFRCSDWLEHTSHYTFTNKVIICKCLPTRDPPQRLKTSCYTDVSIFVYG